MTIPTMSRITSPLSSIGLLAFLVAAPFASACGSATGDDTSVEDAVGVSRDAIIGGADATMAEWGALVKLIIPGGFICSGALLSDTWVLTARHCIPGAEALAPPVNPSLTIKNLNGVSRSVAEAFYMPGEYIGTPGNPYTTETDVALLRVSAPFPLDFGQSSAALHYLYPYGTRGLAGQEARCAGLGRRTFAGSSGTASWASITVNAAWQDLILFKPKDDGSAIQAPGDSGGPCTKPTVPATAQFQFTVLSGATWKGTTGTIESAEGPSSQSFRDWALAVMRLGVGLYSERNYKGNVETIANSASALARVGPRVASVRVPPGWQVNLWDSAIPGFGSSYLVTGDLPDVPASWRDRVQSVEVLQNGVQIFRDASFAGTTRTLAPGKYDAADLGTLNNNISSLRIPSDWRVKVYADPGFSGARRMLYGSTIGSLGTAYNDNISSIEVEQAVTVYTEEFLFGNYQILWEGDFDHDDLVIPFASASSIIVPPGYKVTAFDPEGQYLTFTSTQLWMPDGWNDRITRLSVNPLKPAR